MIRVSILGASGFVGAELLRLLAGHPAFAVDRLFGDRHAGSALAEVYPHLAVHYPEARIEPFEPAKLEASELAFLALPHGQSQHLAAELLNRGLRIVDLGADFRLHSAEEYEAWYGEPHAAPDLLGSFVYGIPELERAALRSARAVAAAGCYATAAILALKPLMALIEPDSLVVDAASGVTGAGRSLSERTSFAAANDSLSAYGLLRHRHTAEMQMALGARVLFTPHLAPMSRGILATCHGVASGPLSADEAIDTLSHAYRDEPFVHVGAQPPETGWCTGSNVVHLTARYDERTGRVISIAALDNLGKGAAGQMIQCANLMTGQIESAGLATIGVYP